MSVATLQLELIFEGHVPSKKNSGRMVSRFGKGGRQRSFRLPSEVYCDWHRRELLSLLAGIPQLEVLARQHEPVKDFEPVWYDGEQGQIELAALVKALRQEPAIYPPPYRLEYDFYPGGLKEFDLSNAEESINDLLVDARLIQDDSWSYLRQREGAVRGFSQAGEYAVVRLYSLPPDGARGVIEALKDAGAIRALAERDNCTQKAAKERLATMLDKALAGAGEGT